MDDGKRENAVSLLPIIPEDSDTGRTYTCRVLNPAAPAGRQTSVTINVQRECPTYRLPVNIQALRSFFFYITVTFESYFLPDPPAVTLSVQPQTVTEGAKVLFICSASANPEITGYRYARSVKFLFLEWDPVTGSGHQVSEKSQERSRTR